LRAAGVIIDIHAEHTYAEALDAERQRFTQVYHATPALLHSIDARGDSLMVSDYWVARMGWPREQVIGAPGWTFMEAASAVRLRDEVIPRTLATGWCENEPAIALTARGERLDLRLSAFVERDADGEPVAAHGVFSDVTDLAQARRTAEDHAAALERSNRELDRFAAIASHDLQEPLRKISAFAGLLQRNLGEGLDPASRQALDFLVDAAGRQRILIDDLLAYSRAANRVFQPKSIALGPVVSEVLASLDLQIEEAGAHMEIGELPAITGDRVLLGLMVRNLLSNALKYRKGPGVQITLAATLTEAGRAVLSVADDGIGIDPVFFEKIFEPFARLHEREAYSGTGIGLAICQQAVERMGGSINVESAPGEGARFVVDLPTAPSDP
jgi:PAS domain S-box-containing protein